MTDKILQEEILSDEQLEQVAGGSWKQTGNDSNFFKQLKLNKKSVGESWSQFGIEFQSLAGENVYKTGEKNYSQVEAYSMVLSKIQYPGFIGDGNNADYTKEFVKNNFGLDLNLK